MRYALIAGTDDEQIARYLPGNYEIIVANWRDQIIVTGEDNAGWTLDGYVLPRLASGLHFGREVNGRELEIVYSEVAMHVGIAGHKCHVIEEDRFANGNEIPEGDRLGCYVIDPERGIVPMLKGEAGWLR